MKRCFLVVITILLLSGCKKNDTSDIVKKFSDNVSSSDSYSLVGNMILKADEEEFEYEFSVDYLKDNYYKVDLNNVNNGHKQVILRNDDGVYVITPEINKSFKFQSSWPNNGSQSYLLQSLLKDINNDNKVKSRIKGGMYIISTTVNYPNNTELVKEDIYFDNNMNIKKVIVFDDNNNERIITKFTKVDMKPKISKDNFKIDEYIKDDGNNIKNNCETGNCDKTVSNVLEDIIYPLYLPNNTYLTSSEKVGENGNRVILTFSGDKSFTIVEENTLLPTSFEITPVYGDPILLNDTLGVISDNSVRWNKGTVSYFMTSNTLTGAEMVMIASSMNYTLGVLGSK